MVDKGLLWVMFSINHGQWTYPVLVYNINNNGELSCIGPIRNIGHTANFHKAELQNKKY